MAFSEFHASLLAQYGPEAAAARHEIFFIARRPSRLLQCARATFAALRDALSCVRLTRATQPLPGVVAIVTLAGASGWRCLAPFLDDLKAREIACATLIHPRLRGQLEGRLPCPPSARAWRHALAALTLRFAKTDHDVAPAWVVRCGIFRQRLWRGALERTLTGGGLLLLHNDFDLFSVAAIESGRDRWRSVCVQHGLPTDEFFPTRADAQVVWGETSAQVYARQGVHSTTLYYGVPPSIDATTDASRPKSLCVISQTHTPIFGRSLAADFRDLAQQLAQRRTDEPQLAILLHPGEIRDGHPYTADLAALCHTPPHPTLQQATPKAIVIGFCSTALIDAACRGHYVIGMDWLVPDSQSALAVGRPAHVAKDFTTLADMLQELLEQPAARQRFLATQDAWLQCLFVRDPQWPQRIGAQP